LSGRALAAIVLAFMHSPYKSTPRGGHVRDDNGIFFDLAKHTCPINEKAVELHFHDFTAPFSFAYTRSAAEQTTISFRLSLQNTIIIPFRR
jgi:hypothetical protein